MADALGGHNTLLPASNGYGAFVHKRTDERTPARDPPRRRRDETPRSMPDKKESRKLGGGAGGDGNDSDDEDGRESSRAHAGEIPLKGRADEFQWTDRYGYTTGNYTWVRKEYLESNHPAGSKDREYGASGRSTYDAPYDYMFPQNSTEQSQFAEHVSKTSSGQHHHSKGDDDCDQNNGNGNFQNPDLRNLGIEDPNPWADHQSEGSRLEGKGKQTEVQAIGKWPEEIPVSESVNFDEGTGAWNSEYQQDGDFPEFEPSTAGPVTVDYGHQDEVGLVEASGALSGDEDGDKKIPRSVKMSGKGSEKRESRRH